MPALQIRDLPQGTYDALKLRAEREHRSLAQQATALTEEEERQARIAKRKALFAEIDAAPKIDIPDDFPTSAEIVRELRDSR